MSKIEHKEEKYLSISPIKSNSVDNGDRLGISGIGDIPNLARPL